MEISRGRGYLNLKMVIKHEWRSRLISFALANNSLGENNMLRIKEMLVDMYECKGDLNNEKFLCETLETAAKNVGAKVIHKTTQRFSPIGVSVILILAETHISIHTWPEYRYAALDIFICGEGKNPEVAWNVIKEALKPKKFRIKKIERIVGKQGDFEREESR